MRFSAIVVAALLALLIGCDDGSSRCAWKCQMLFGDPPGSPMTATTHKDAAGFLERHEWVCNGKICCCVVSFKRKEHFFEHAWLGTCQSKSSGQLPEKVNP